MAYFDMNNEPGVDRLDMEYTIYVNSLPVELNEDGIRDIFGQYGKITGMFHPRNATWTYITYGTYREAELAIRQLDNKKPLYLKVALAKEKSSTKEEQKSNASVIEKPKVVNAAESLPIHNDVKYQSMGRGQSTIPLCNVIPQVTPLYRCTDGSYSQTLGIELEDSYTNPNKLWTRGVITVTPDRRRHVSLGRGYTLYEYPEPYPKIEECISEVYEQRNNGLYEYSKDKLKSGVQSCSVCSTKTIKHCEKCHTYYCSKACQLEDWPQHQAECERIPALVEESINDISLLQINQDVNQTKKISVPNTINKPAKSTDVKLRRPNTINAMNNSIQDRYLSGQHDNVSQVKMTDQSIGNATNIKEFIPQHRLHRYNDTNENQLKKNGHFSGSTEQSHHNYESDSNRTNLTKETYDNSNVRDKTYNDDRNHPQKNCFQSDKGFACHTSRENTNRQEGTSYNSSMNNDVAFYKDTHLSKTKFTMVEIIIQLDNDEYWISKVEDRDARINLMKKLQDVADKSHNVQPIIGEVYGVLYETLWHRAMVTSLNPIKIHFIDFGNDAILKKNDEIRNIEDLVKAPKFARKIRLTQGTCDKYRNLQEGDNISVKMLSVDSEKTIIVEVQEENLSSHTMESVSSNAVKKLVRQENQVSPNKNIQASTVQIPNVLDALAELLMQKAVPELQIEGVIQFWESAQKNVYSVTLIPQIYSTEMEMIFNDLQEYCSEVQAAADYKPKAEELICGKCSDGWYRGYISVYPETSNSSIIAIDEARIQSADKILPCPKKYLNICAFGVMCEINQSAIEVQVGSVYKFTAVMNQKNNPKQESLKIEIVINSEIIQAVVRSRKSVANSSMPVLELKNGSKICLTSYRSHYSMFVRSLDEEQVEYYNSVMQSVARYAQIAPHLTEPPVHQQIVIAPFMDGNSYRAMILKTENDKAKIVYVDFGNIDEVNIKDLKVMPQSHSMKQTCARIVLKDVRPDLSSNQEVDLYIRNLLGNEVPLVCTYEGTSSKDGVRLIMPTGECVNDKINQLLIPAWKRENNDNTCYMLHDIKIASLGRVGDTVDAVILFIREDKTVYMMAPHDIELLTYISNKLPMTLTEYCEKTEYYIPRMEELCLALYEGAWYRAACLNPKESHQTAQILFIDYGNIETVEHKNIRLMPKDFIAPPAMANLCTVVNLAPVNSNGNYSEAIQKKIAELVLPNSPVKIKLVECCENGDYKVELPDVRNALIRDGLV